MRILNNLQMAQPGDNPVRIGNGQGMHAAGGHRDKAMIGAGAVSGKIEARRLVYNYASN